MKASPTLLAVRNRTRQLARSLTALQLCCPSLTYTQRLPELATVLNSYARHIDELEVMSAGTPFNDLIEQATNTCDTSELADQLRHEGVRP